jgi:hypothetical protein
MSVRRIAAGVAAMALLLLPSELRAGEEWPDGPNKNWFQNLQRPDNDISTSTGHQIALLLRNR